MAEIDVDNVLAELTQDEKISLTAGRDFWHTVAIPRLGLPSIRLSDGPNGVRGTRFFNGVPAACVPCGTGLGATWDVNLLQEVGTLLGLEAKAKGAHVILGPTINIQRSPLGGRGFESYSEDPLLSGNMAAAFCKGVKSENIIPTLKHFVCNDMEDKRMSVNSIVSERALREIYLMPFMLAVRDANPGAFMTAYSKLNGTHCSENRRLLQDILRTEWKWDGLVMSDWYGTYSTAEAINAGLDLEMPGPSRFRSGILGHAILSNKVSEHVLDERVRNILNAISKAAKSGIKENQAEAQRDTPEDKALMRRTAADSIVLLMNDGNILPFKKDKTIAVIGPNADVAVVSGGGSASLLPYSTVSPLQGLQAQCADVKFAQGIYGHKKMPLLNEHLKQKDGTPGFTMRVFNEPPSAMNRVCVDELHIKDTVMFLMDYENPRITSPKFYADIEGYITPSETAEWEFSLSVAGTARLLIDGKEIIDNVHNQVAGDAFFGSGTVDVPGKVNLTAGVQHKIFVEFGSASTSTLNDSNTPLLLNGGVRIGGCPVRDLEASIDAAVKLARETDQVVIFAGLNSDWESEGYDRSDMSLPPHTDDLISRVIAANPNAAVVIQSGTPVNMPWLPECKALAHAWFGGNEGGNGIADVLLGIVNPSAKLPITFPARVQDNPAFLSAKSEGGRMLYGEDVFVGYRHYDILSLPVAFPFGHGLSYTSFSFSDLDVKIDGDKLVVEVTVENTGTLDGKEVVQVYVSQEKCSVTRPVKELKGFTKISLKKGKKERVTVSMQLKYATSFWDETRDDWLVEKGGFKVLVGSSSRGNFLEGKLNVEKNLRWRGI